MARWNNIWRFETKRFAVTLDWEWEESPDLSWDDTGETLAKCNSGEWGVYTFRVRVTCDGREIACDYLGNSIYADPQEFWHEHFGVRPFSRARGSSYGTYFSDMLSQAVSEARKALGNVPRVRNAG